MEQQYVISAEAILIRKDGTRGAFSAKVQRANSPNAKETALTYFFKDAGPEGTEGIQNPCNSGSDMRYMGIFRISEEIEVEFRDETNYPGFVDTANVPVVCVDLVDGLTMEMERGGVQLKVYFSIKEAKGISAPTGTALTLGGVVGGAESADTAEGEGASVWLEVGSPLGVQGVVAMASPAGTAGVSVQMGPLSGLYSSLTGGLSGLVSVS
jgi:hypothetical protein